MGPFLSISIVSGKLHISGLLSSLVAVSTELDSQCVGF